MIDCAEELRLIEDQSLDRTPYVPNRLAGIGCAGTYYPLQRYPH